MPQCLTNSRELESLTAGMKVLLKALQDGSLRKTPLLMASGQKNPGTEKSPADFFSKLSL